MSDQMAMFGEPPTLPYQGNHLGGGRIMRTFFVTFGMGTILRGYYQEFMAKDECIVTAFCNKRYGGLWSSVYAAKPKGKPLQAAPEMLCYEHARHVD